MVERLKGQAKAGRACALLVFLLAMGLLVLGCDRVPDSQRWTYRDTEPADGPSLSDHIDFLEERLKDRPRAYLEMAELASFYLQRARSRRSSEDTEKALFWIERSLEEFESSSGLLVKADYLQMHHRFQEAVDLLDRVRAREPANQGAVLLLVKILLARGEGDEAAGLMESVTKVPLSSVLMLRGQVAETRGREDEARDLYTRAIAAEGGLGSKSESARMRGMLARLELEAGNLQEASALLEAAHQIPVEQPLTELLRARLSARQGEYDQATALLRAAYEHYRDPVFLVRLGEIQSEAGREEAAKSSFRTAAELLQADPLGHERDLALALFRLDRKANAERIEELMDRELERRTDEETLRINELVR